MIMGLFIGYGHGPRGWDDPGLRSNYDWRRPEVYQDLALVCERDIFDLMVFADVLGIPEAFRGSQDTSIRFGLEGICHDPIPLIAMIAAKAEKIGLASTLSTTLYPPFLLARLMSTLDHLTRGRVGWNVVTSSNQTSAKISARTACPSTTIATTSPRNTWTCATGCGRAGSPTRWSPRTTTSSSPIRARST